DPETGYVFSEDEITPNFVNYEDHLDRQLLDPEFAADWEAVDPQYEAALVLMKARTSLNLSQAEFAAKAGVRTRYIQATENGDANPTVKALGRLLAAHGLRLRMQIEKSRVVEARERSQAQPATQK